MRASQLHDVREYVDPGHRGRAWGAPVAMSLVLVALVVVVVRNRFRDYVFVWGEVLAVQDRGRTGFGPGGLHFVLAWGAVECDAFLSGHFSGRESDYALREVLADAEELRAAWFARSGTIASSPV